MVWCIGVVVYGVSRTTMRKNDMSTLREGKLCTSPTRQGESCDGESVAFEREYERGGGEEEGNMEVRRAIKKVST